VSCLLALDISAAFDVLDHRVLIRRAESVFGLSGQVLSWLSSFLSDRTSSVSLGQIGTLSYSSAVPTLITCGVPQGSTLGPLLFALFVSPLESLVLSRGEKCHQYADDTQLYIRIISGTDLLGALESCADEVAHWFLANGLMVNPSKTEAILFGSSSRLASLMTSHPDLTFKFAGATVPFVSSLRILGVTLDSNLSFDIHVSKTLANCNTHLRALRHVRSSLTLNAATTIACSLINTRIDYCNSLLYNTSNNNIVKLQILQNNLARCIFRQRRSVSMRPFINRLHWLRINERILYKLSVLSYNVVRMKQPPYLADIIRPQQSARTLRSNLRDLLFVPCRKLEILRSSFSYACPTVWNNLSEHVKMSDSIDIFKSRLKTELFTSAS
jgi:Reverse transcriptase (RNA-dependent DNA polymerase)